MEPRRFEVTLEHMKLLPHLWFEYDAYTEFGAPEVDPKRPYGNSDVYDDLGEHLGITPDGPDDGYGDKDWSESQQDYLFAIHKSMTTVLNILVHVAEQGISPGWYQAAAYGNNWKRED